MMTDRYFIIFTVVLLSLAVCTGLSYFLLPIARTASPQQRSEEWTRIQQEYQTELTQLRKLRQEIQTSWDAEQRLWQEEKILWEEYKSQLGQHKTHILRTQDQVQRMDRILSKLEQPSAATP